ncbi:MAG TPA: type VII secretion protein EccCb [Ktedonobacteraceae bacterium]|nr:type VII secretion protein EccCb [Ktedonobacteraceae bacterium]
MAMRGTTFYRPARVYPPVLPSDDIIVSAPPILQPAQSGAMGWLQYVLPSVGMLGSAVFIFAFGFNPIMIILGIVMAVSFVGSGIIMGVIQRHTVKKQRQQLRTSYLEYLTHLRKRLFFLAKEQRLIDSRLYPSYDELVARVEQRAYLWERRPADNDFLSVRIGSGPGLLCCRLQLDQGRSDFSVQYIPDLRAQADALINEYSYLHDLSATIPLRLFSVITITGERTRTRALARALLAQAVANHSPEDLRCLVYFPVQQARDWTWLKWVPHARRLRQVKAEQRYAPEQRCMLATTAEDFRLLLSQQIKPELDRRHRLLEEAGNNLEPERALASRISLPHLLIFVDGFSPTRSLEPLPELEMLLSESPVMGITTVCLVDDISQEPAQVQARLSIVPTGGLNFQELRYGGHRREGLLPDSAEPEQCERIARSIAPIMLAETSGQQDISADVRLLDLLEVPSADLVDPSTTWQLRSRSDLLRVPLGVRSDGRLIFLDLKEAAAGGMGPHGLIVGATGSGKSELLRTLVTALAIKHDPETLNFVLVDFKGGASFADFAALPHVAGIITNLQTDQSLIDRAYSSLLGEQQRRQNILHDAGNLDNLKQYEEMRRLHPEMEPMPHLVIIVDEFAELIANRPDFLDLFVTMGRVGRSLGLYLLFATQRLEEGRIKGLESHLRYRICLRTYSAMESKTVLGTPDAYYLPSMPGVGYFKVDTDVYEFFKTALISVPYVPFREQTSLASKVRLFTSDGKLLHYERMGTGEIKPSDLRTEMDVIIERLRQAGQGQIVHQVWLPPLESVLPLGKVLQKYGRTDLDGSHWDVSPPFGELRVPTGLVDMPLQQAQEALWLDFSGIGGHLALVGAPQSGKSTLLRTLITAFLITHSPRSVQFYCIDLGGGLLRVFEQAPHVGAVCGKADRDKIRRVVRQMRKIIEEREFLFRERGIDSMATFRERRQQGQLEDVPFGDVFLIIDNFAQFFQEFDQLEPELIEIAASGLAYGVHLILATNRWAEIRAKIRDNIGTRLELRLNDIMESDLGKAVASSIPVGVPGRGANRDKLHFQVALPIVDDHVGQEGLNAGVQEALNALVQRTRTAWKGEPAPPINMLPQLVKWEDLPAPAPDQPAGVPLGLEEFRLSPLYVDLLSSIGPHFIILGDTECGKTSLLRAWMHGIEQRYSTKEISFAIVDFRKRLLDLADSKHLLTYAYNAQTLASCIGNLKVDLDKRMQKSSDVPLNELRRPQRFEGRHYFLFVDDYESIMSGGSSPVAQLADYLLPGQDIGFHLIVAHRVGGIGRASYETVFQRLREMGTAAIIMSGDPMEGKIFYGVAASSLPPGRGYLVQPKHPPVLIQAAFAQPAYSYD